MTYDVLLTLILSNLKQRIITNIVAVTIDSAP